jgi:hypothetical protein
MARMHKRYGKRRRRNPGGEPAARRSNPAGLAEVAEFALPGFGAFGASRFLSRIAAVQVARARPAWGKHAGVAMALLAAAAAHYGSRRVKVLEKYEQPLTVGAVIAFLQTFIQTYLPKLGWMLSDASPQLAEESRVDTLSATAPVNTLTEGLEELDEDPAAYTYNDSYDAGRTTPGPVPQTANAAGANPAVNDDLVDLDDLATADLGSLSAN